MEIAARYTVRPARLCWVGRMRTEEALPTLSRAPAELYNPIRFGFNTEAQKMEFGVSGMRRPEKMSGGIVEVERPRIYSLFGCSRSETVIPMADPKTGGSVTIIRIPEMKSGRLSAFEELNTKG